MSEKDKTEEQKHAGDAEEGQEEPVKKGKIRGDPIVILG